MGSLNNVKNAASVFGHRSSFPFDKENTLTGRKAYTQILKKSILNPNVNFITGVICGYRVEEIENPLTQKERYLDKLVDELAKGRKMEKILRAAKKN